MLIAKCLGIDEKVRVKMSRRAWLRDEMSKEEQANAAVEETTKPLA